MASYQTRFGSLDDYDKGGVTVIDDDPRNYVFSNVFEVASGAVPFEKVAVAENMEYVLETVRVEGTSPWRASRHDEFALVMSGEVTFDFVDVGPVGGDLPEQGSAELASSPEGQPMGQVVGRQGHMVLLPAGAAYRYAAVHPAALLLQTMASADTHYRWAEICQTR
ncbi:MAG: hydroxyquinol 1,2-dioxygenase [Acidimicrobiales bacterium]